MRNYTRIVSLGVWGYDLCSAGSHGAAIHHPVTISEKLSGAC